jgi:hypothetical protein
MRLRDAVLATAIAVTSSLAMASMPFPIPLKELYAESKSVAVVEVLEGRIVMAGGDTCGARYKGRVVEPVKNATPGAIIEFGYLPSLKMGGAYLVLLGDFNDVSLPQVPDFLERCRAALPSAAIMAHWRGALEVVGDTSKPEKRQTWTVRQPKYVVFPLGTRTTVVEGEKQLWFSDLVKRLVGEQ